MKPAEGETYEKEILNYTQNRELSWLRFNQRVLEEAQDESVPLLERMKFVSIFTSNLDEFFMIRVGSLYDMASVDSKTLDSRSGMTPKEQLDKIYEAVAPLYKERDKTYAEIKNSCIHTGSVGWISKSWRHRKKVCQTLFQRTGASTAFPTDRRRKSSVSTFAQ